MAGPQSFGLASRTVKKQKAKESHRTLFVERCRLEEMHLPLGQPLPRTRPCHPAATARDEPDESTNQKNPAITDSGVPNQLVRQCKTHLQVKTIGIDIL
jgi:hypothetical protein